MPTQQMTADNFKEKVFDYEGTEEWKFKGDRPAIIDFYADWCGPCKAVAPILEELSNEYKGRLDVYKVDTEAEAALSSLFGIQSIPTFLFIPTAGKPMLQRGALQKTVFKEIIEQRLLNNYVDEQA